MGRGRSGAGKGGFKPEMPNAAQTIDAMIAHIQRYGGSTNGKSMQYVTKNGDVHTMTVYASTRQRFMPNASNWFMYIGDSNGNTISRGSAVTLQQVQTWLKKNAK